jgi:hypothetical protein
MLNGVLTGLKEGDAKLDHQGVGVMDTYGFTLFSHDLQDGSRNLEWSNPEILSPSDLSSEEDKVNTKNLLFTDGCRSLIDCIEAHTNGLLLVTVVCTDAWSCYICDDEHLLLLAINCLAEIIPH